MEDILQIKNDQNQEEEKQKLSQNNNLIQIDLKEGEREVLENNEENLGDVSYKFNTPMFQTEVDWTISLSRNDFPWHEIRFGIFTAKECFEKYFSIVKDPQTFLKKVLGNKEKYKKMMHSQLNQQ